MVYPPISTDSTSRSLESSAQSTLCQSQSSVSPLLIPHHHHHPQQQQLHQQLQQQILYTPYNTIPTCITPTNQPQCIYPNTRRNLTNTATLRNQDHFRGVKNTKWKSRSVRVKEHQTNPNIQHSIPYPPPPLVLFDPIQNHLSTTPAAPITPIYVNRSSTLFNHGGVYSNENYTNYTPNMITPPYYKPPEMQTYCLIDRPSTQSTFGHQQTIPPGSNYYNPTSNTNINHQNIKSFVTSTSNVYSSVVNNDSRIIPTTVGPTQIFPSSLNNHGLNLTNYSSDKLMANSISSIKNELSMIKHPKKVFTEKDERIISEADRLFTVNIDIDSEKLSTTNTDNIRIIKNQCDERFLDESSNFDFTIEAEKMVSALCNTTSCELDQEGHQRDEPRSINNKLPSHDKDIENILYKSHESIDKSYKPWYFSDFSTEIKLSGESIGTQTTDTSIDMSQYPELIRKTIYWGCNEADKIMKNSSSTSSKQSWLWNLSSATKIALTKSSTSFPIFSGDKILAQDLISSLLRVGNGWLILDHYLNKHHHPTLDDKYDSELIESFKRWEVSTNNLLQNIIKTFVKLEISNFSNDESVSVNSTIIDSSFPGDISLYVNYGLFGDPSSVMFPFPSTTQPMELKSATSFIRKCPYMNNENREKKNRWSTGKESKLRTKWTISEHSKGSTEVTRRNHDEKDSWDLFPKDFPVSQLINTIEPQQKLHCNFFTSLNNSNLNYTKQLTTTNSSLNTESISNDKNRQFWNPCIAPSPLYKFAYNDPNLHKPSNEITLMNKIDTKKNETIVSNAVNLSSWFSTIRNKRSSNVENSSSAWSSLVSKTASKFCESKSVNSKFRMDTNRQLRTLKNMRTIQCAPWTVNNLMDDHQTSKPTPDEYDSSEDVRVYMKPGSYNVPKKKNQSRRSQKRDSSTLRNNRHIVPINNEIANLSNSLIVSRSNISSPSSSTCSQDAKNKDATWKAACASAGLLLNALKTKDKIKNDTMLISTPKNAEKSLRHKMDLIDDENTKNKISFKLTSNDSKSLQLLSSSTSEPSHNEQQKNIKTDSWLIRTLNNVTDETNNDKKQSENEYSNKINISLQNKSLNDDRKSEERSFAVDTSHTIAVMTLVDVVGKATYSETVRRIPSSSKLTSSPKMKIIQRKNGEREKIENNSLCTIDESKNEEREALIKHDDIEVKSDKLINLKKNKNGNDDRDWSVWYSSKKKQHNNSLGQVALGKLVNIHRAMWRIDVTRLLKCPTLNTQGTDNPIIESINMENYRKIVKSPMFLETIGYKLKNHEYRKVENAICDFRRIIHNSKLYHKNNNDCIERIENLSKKLEELVQQNFADELSLYGKNIPPIHNQKSPNRLSMSSSTNTIINSNSPITTLIYNAEKETPFACRKSSRTS